MKRSNLLKLAAIAALVITATGCSPYSKFGDGTAYSANERGKLIAHSWDVDGKQLVDDVDSVLLLHPSSSMSSWNVP